MKTHSPVTTTAGLGLAALILTLSSCAGPKYTAMNHRGYTRMPDCSSSKLWRGIAKSNPWTAKAAFHGNWGGSGNEGGEPVDEMDECFRRHDIVYYESRCGKHLKAADQELVEWLEALDEDTLNPEQSKYRKRAIKFMSSPMANFVGKPPAVMLRKEERDGCYFASTEDIMTFFDPSHPGFPDVEASVAFADSRRASDLVSVPEKPASTMSSSGPSGGDTPTLIASQ